MSVMYKLFQQREVKRAPNELYKAVKQQGRQK